MKAPKILPWVARKTGISEELALKLWRRAAGEAELMTGCCESSDYYGWAVERFLDLAESEGGRPVVNDPKNTRTCVHWLSRFEHRISKLNLMTAQCLARFWCAKWRDFISAQHHAT